MSKKRFWAILAAACMIFSMVGCKQNGTFAKQIIEESEQITTVSEQTSEESEKINRVKKEPYYITEWSIDDLVKSVEINGVIYSMPFTFNDLGEGYTIEKINDCLFLYYHGEDYALIEVKDNSDINNSEIINLTTYYSYLDKDFKIGDTSLGDELDDVLEKYGEPSLKVTAETVLGIYYVFEGETESQNNVLGFTFTNGKLGGISVIYNKYEEEQI